MTLWEGEFEWVRGRWLRWTDAQGELIPTGKERADQEAAARRAAETRVQQEAAVRREAAARQAAETRVHQEAAARHQEAAARRQEAAARQAAEARVAELEALLGRRST